MTVGWKRNHEMKAATHARCINNESKARAKFGKFNGALICNLLRKLTAVDRFANFQQYSHMEYGQYFPGSSHFVNSSPSSRLYQINLSINLILTFKNWCSETGKLTKTALFVELKQNESHLV